MHHPERIAASVCGSSATRIFASPRWRAPRLGDLASGQRDLRGHPGALLLRAHTRGGVAAAYDLVEPRRHLDLQRLEAALLLLGRAQHLDQLDLGEVGQLETGCGGECHDHTLLEQTFENKGP